MSQDMDDDEDWELEDDDEEEQMGNEDPTRQLDVDLCPPNLDQKLYDEIVALREKRLDLGTLRFLSILIESTRITLFFLDEAIADEKAVLQSYQQTLGQTQIFSNKVDAELKTRKADLIDFQVKKT